MKEKNKQTKHLIIKAVMNGQINELTFLLFGISYIANPNFLNPTNTDKPKKQTVGESDA